MPRSCISEAVNLCNSDGRVRDPNIIFKKKKLRLSLPIKFAVIRYARNEVRTSTSRSIAVSMAYTIW